MRSAAIDFKLPRELDIARSAPGMQNFYGRRNSRVPYPFRKLTPSPILYLVFPLPPSLVMCPIELDATELEPARSHRGMPGSTIPGTSSELTFPAYSGTGMQMIAAGWLRIRARTIWNNRADEGGETRVEDKRLLAFLFYTQS